MKKLVFVLSFIMVLGFSNLGNTTLWDRGGGLIYDDALNITWLQDANYARTSGYDADSGMTWQQSKDWVDNLSYYDSVRDVTWTDWRLPQVSPVNGTSYVYFPFAYDGSVDIGWNISAPGSANPGTLVSEMAYLYYNSLGNVGAYDFNGNHCVGWPGCYIPLQNTGPFVNIRQQNYWSDTEIPNQITAAFHFNFGSWSAGVQGMTGKQVDYDIAWAVREGDVAVPEPTTMILLGLGLIGLAGVRRKMQR
jgi:hypothetical protein